MSEYRQQLLTARDYTSVKHRERRLWDVGGFSIPGGLDTGPLLIVVLGAVVAAALTVPVVLLLTRDFTWLLLCLATGLVGGIIGWFVGRRPINGSLTTIQSALVTLDWVFRQPRKIQGSHKDAEPDLIRWQIIAWEPADDQPWWSTFYAFLEHYTRKGGRE